VTEAARGKKGFSAQNCSVRVGAGRHEVSKKEKERGGTKKGRNSLGKRNGRRVEEHGKPTLIRRITYKECKVNLETC